MLRICAASKTYKAKTGGPVQALIDTEFEVERGEFVMVVGPSGSGKSTLLYIMGAMLKPTAGKVFLHDTDVYALSATARTKLRSVRIGFLFQTFNLVPYLSCLDNVILPAVLAGRNRGESMAAARRLLERLGLAHREQHVPTELSVGERQRAALCRSLVNEPDVLLVDEPTGNLDDEMAAEVRKMLREFNDDGQTIVTVTHDSRLADAGSRTIGLRAGRIVSDETEKRMIPA